MAYRSARGGEGAAAGGNPSRNAQRNAVGNPVRNAFINPVRNPLTNPLRDPVRNAFTNAVRNPEELVSCVDVGGCGKVCVGFGERVTSVENISPENRAVKGFPVVTELSSTCT